ncbi:mannosyl transferase [Siphonobacter sp. BAB-5405]|uniref:glycosyltransferase family 4 protein n=1 Tax=Siphonobacter sp. BAB-5405 TaxID=1864825 RepID=UPI000C80D98B|nr:glycosyltransferase family 1 protein [Siphonobacter sp. BAB-5405]PMD90722.1 mannosyl transferase [Siphonobacter sp. BAB-5405]
MNLVFFTHPPFLDSQSMPRYAKWLSESMKARGHEVTVWAPQPYWYRLPVPRTLKKWLGYIDQYILFPRQVKRRIRQQPPDSLYIFTDNALGPWVPLVARQPHLIHCHDFTAQRSAVGEIPENPTGFTGRRYQALIRQGYRKGTHFLSISEKTRLDLHRFLGFRPQTSEVVYNGLNPVYQVRDVELSREELQEKIQINLANGYLLHVGGNQWYKNRKGVLKMYEAWRKQSHQVLPLLLIGDAPSAELQVMWQANDYQQDIHFVSQLTDRFVSYAYAGASAFLFPSLAEGFGWPIAEAMACGCPVFTTNEAPMTEVAGDAAVLIPRMPAETIAQQAWAAEAGQTLESVLNASATAKTARRELGLAQVHRFNARQAIIEIEHIYEGILARTQTTLPQTDLQTA